MRLTVKIKRAYINHKINNTPHWRLKSRVVKQTLYSNSLCGDNWVLHCNTINSLCELCISCPITLCIAVVRLVIHSSPFFNLQKLRQRQRINFIFQLILIKPFIILMLGQRGRLSQGLHVYHAAQWQTKVRLGCDVRVYICICVAACVCRCI